MTTAGQRIADLRRRQGLSQAQVVAGLPLSYSYVSLIETGKRQPGRRVLEMLAERLGTTAEYLRTGRGPEVRTLEYDLRFAELALKSGDPGAALERFTAVHRQATALGAAYVAERHEALYGMSCAHAVLGDLPAAVRGFEELAAAPDLPSSVDRVRLHVWLCRTHQQAGDLARAIDLAEAALAGLGAAGGAFVSDEATELASTLVLAYRERGDLTKAQLLIESVLAGAEASGSLRARAAACWNAALVAEARGELRAAQRMTERALALFGEIGHVWAVASLRANSGALLLRLPEPRVAEAADLLRQALDDLVGVGGPPDIAAAETELARCLLLAGELDQAIAVARTAIARLEGGAGLEGARGRAVLATALVAAGDQEAAMAAFTAAARALEAEGAHRQTAPVWRELADVLVAMGRKDEAIAAYERMGAAVGVPASPARPAPMVPGR